MGLADAKSHILVPKMIRNHKTPPPLTPELLEAARTTTDSMLDLNSWGRKGGTVVERPDGIAQAVESCLAHPEEGSAVRRAIARDLFYNASGATETAMAWLEANVLARPAPGFGPRAEAASVGPRPAPAMDVTLAARGDGHAVPRQAGTGGSKGWPEGVR